MVEWLKAVFKPLTWLFDHAALILTIKEKKAQRVAFGLALLVCILLVPAIMWGWWQYQNYQFHQKNPNASNETNKLAPPKPEAK